ncbi:unnamed protein product [Orchesella dallaii]|uniref:Uncharacterized protein n=1 Tax=Orchesella dallaii TaxID=48710 RepID=A0ABP1PRS6_9HEXA
MGNEESYNPYRCRTAVRIIAVLDILFSTFLLGFYLLRLAFYEGKDGDMTTGLFFKYGIITDPQPFYYFTDELQRYYIFIWIAIFFIYTLQLIMAIILLFGACQNGTEDARRRCKVWCSSLAFIKSSVGIEFFILAQTFAKFGLNYVALSLWSTKLIFRLLAEKVVCAFVKDLNKAYVYTHRNSYPFY